MLARRMPMNKRVEPRMGDDRPADQGPERLVAPKRKTSATMKAALLASAFAHVGVFGYAFFVWASPDAAEMPAIDNVSVDIVDIADETALTLGDETGDEAEEEAVRTVEAEREAEEVQTGEVRDAPVREVARETQPPAPRTPPAPETREPRDVPVVREVPINRTPTEATPEPEVAAVEPDPTPESEPAVAEPAAAEAPETQVAAAPLPPAPLGRPAGLRAPAPKPTVVAEAPAPSQTAPSQPVQPTPQPEQQVAVVQPQPQPTEPAPVTEPTPPEADPLLNSLDPDRIAALLNKQEPVAAAAPTQSAASETPSLGAIDGAGDTLTISEIGALRRRLAECWTPPLGARGAETLTVKVNMVLNQDGSVRGVPTVVDAPFGPAAEAASQAAVRAALQCQPYNLPPQKYAVWENITINFDPRQMLGL